MPSRKSVMTAAQKAAARDDLVNHLIGHHAIPRLDIESKPTKDLKALHAEVKTTRWCRITNTTRRKRYASPGV